MRDGKSGRIRGGGEGDIASPAEKASHKRAHTTFILLFERKINHTRIREFLWLVVPQRHCVHSLAPHNATSYTIYSIYMFSICLRYNLVIILFPRL